MPLTEQKRYRFITITRDRSIEKPGLNDHPEFSVINNRSKDVLGRLEYYHPWKCYIFVPTPNSVFNSECLKAITDFIDNHAS